MSEPSLSGKVSLVTGSGRRTGSAIAQRLAAAGACVVLAARTAEELQQTADAIRDSGGEAIAVPTDVISEKSCAALVKRAEEAFGRVDHLINAAGVYRTGPFDTFGSDDWRLTLDTYLSGPFFTCRAALPALRRSGSGHIINISSTLVEMALPGFEAYCAAKAGLEGFSRCLSASLLPDGIKVSVLVPGAINAGGHEPDLDRMLETTDVAEAVLYLLGLPEHVHIPELTLRTAQ